MLYYVNESGGPRYGALILNMRVSWPRVYVVVPHVVAMVDYWQPTQPAPLVALLIVPFSPVIAAFDALHAGDWWRVAEHVRMPT